MSGPAFELRFLNFVSSQLCFSDYASSRSSRGGSETASWRRRRPRSPRGRCRPRALAGDFGNDLFVLRAKEGNDIILDFDALDGDAISFSGLFGSLAAVMAASAQVRSNVVISDTGGSIQLKNVSLLSSTVDDFRF